MLQFCYTNLLIIHIHNRFYDDLVTKDYQTQLIYTNNFTMICYYVIIIYQHVLYRETINNKAYSIETLLGQVGGFVGMFHPLIMVPNTLKLLTM